MMYSKSGPSAMAANSRSHSRSNGLCAALPPPAIGSCSAALAIGSCSASLAGVNQVIVDVTTVRSYQPAAGTLASLNARASAGCILPTGFGAIRRVRAVIIGDVRVRLTFAQGVDLIARAQLAEKLSFALGLGFQRISETEIAGRNIAFGVKWQ